MSSRSNVSSARSEDGPVPGLSSSQKPWVDAAALQAKNARRRAILELCVESDPVRVASIVDRLIEAYQAAAVLDLEFFSVKDLQERWGLSRKSVERLGLPVHRFGGVLRYSRADVLAYETNTRSGAEAADGED